MYREYCDDKAGARIAHLRKQHTPNRRQFVRPIPGLSEIELREIEIDARTARLEEILLLALFLDFPVEYLAFGRGHQQLGDEEKKNIMIILGMPRHKVYEYLTKQRLENETTTP